MMLQQDQTARPYEAGFVRPMDGLVHVVKKGFSARDALCGAGRIETQLVGRFDPDSADACPTCVGLIGGRAAQA
jgi:hypothetical protein